MYVRPIIFEFVDFFKCHGQCIAVIVYIGNGLRCVFLLFFFPDCFPPNIDCGEAILISTHNLCFGSKLRKIGIQVRQETRLTDI